MTMTRAQILAHVYEVIDIEEIVRTYLEDQEGIKTVPVLTSNSDENGRVSFLEATV